MPLVDPGMSFLICWKACCCLCVVAAAPPVASTSFASACSTSASVSASARTSSRILVKSSAALEVEALHSPTSGTSLT